MFFPTSLKKNDLILVIAPAGGVTPCQLTKGLELLKQKGYEVILGKNLYHSYGPFAGTDKQRAEDLQWALNHPKAKAIWMARGGYGSARVVDQVSWKFFQQNPKWIIGFSDITVFHQKCQHLGIASMHGPMVAQMKEDIPTFENCIDHLEGKHTTIKWNSSLSLSENKVTGKLTGGNLSIISSLRSTPLDLIFDDQILFIEDIDEYHYNIDRMLINMVLAGDFAKLKGIIVGAFTQVKEGENPMPFDFKETIIELTQKYNIPVFFDAPIGHINENHPIILGSKVTIQSQKGEVTLSYNQEE